MNIEYFTVNKAKEPILIAQNVKASYGEIVNIKLPNDEVRQGKIIYIDSDKAVIEVYKGVSGINPSTVNIKTTGKLATMKLSPLIIGRFFNGAYEPIDGKPVIDSSYNKDINGLVINPVSREVPKEFIQTGISSIDGLNSIIRGQKIAIFSTKGVNHYDLAAQIVKQSKILNNDEDFAVVFCGLGIPHEISNFFINEFNKKGVIEKSCIFINNADSPIIERITAPRYALTAAEYLAFDQGMHVLVIMIDMTEYCNALRELSGAKEEIPMRKGYPSYMYSDLASIYERCGKISNVNGSVTLLPILTMPNDDITHPIPDLTGYITEGQIILSKELFNKGIYPPINILPSLSRLMHKGIGVNKTREDHFSLSNQIYFSYSKAKQIDETATIIGIDSLNDVERKYLEFKNVFEKTFLNQGLDNNRSIIKTLDLAWDSLKILDKNELTQLSNDLISKYLTKDSNIIEDKNTYK